MDDGGPRDSGRHRVDPYKAVQTPWNTMPPYQMKEMNAFVMHIYAEKHAALEELDRVINERNAAIEERNEAIKQRDEAIAAREIALRDRDNAMAALQFQENLMNGKLDKRGIKRVQQLANHNQVQIPDHYPSSEMSSDNIEFHQEKRVKENSGSSKGAKKGKKLSEDLNVHVSAEDDSQDIDLINQINFDEATVPPPVCSCTGVPRQCYKSGNGGWQSSCCTITLSVYPLPQLPNKRHSRMGGRKMSGNVFSRLLTRLAEEGHDLSVPVDLKNYWAKHGTNRYITVK